MTKKHWIWIASLAVLSVLMLLLIPRTKDGAVRHVLRQQERMEAYAQACMEQPQDHTRYESWNTRYAYHFGVVIFQVSYLGFGSQSNENGIYYSPSGAPNALGMDRGMEETDQGIRYLGEGDNWVCVERIADRWFWFEQHW